MRLLANLLVAVALCGLPAAGQAADKVKVGVFPISSSLPYFVALDLGYFKELNIEPETITLMGGPPNVAALMTNQIEVSVVLVTLEGLNADREEARRGDVRRHAQPERHAIGWSNSSCAPASPTRSTSLKDFKGLKLMSAPGPGQSEHRQGHSRQGRAEGRRLHHRPARHGPARQRHEGRHLRRRLYARAERDDHEQARLSPRRSRPASSPNTSSATRRPMRLPPAAHSRPNSSISGPTSPSASPKPGPRRSTTSANDPRGGAQAPRQEHADAGQRRR